MKTVVVALALVAIGDTLRCYQGEQGASLPLESPMEFLANSRSRLFILDHTKNIVTRACRMSNCTQDAVVVSHPVCTNSTDIDEWPHIDGLGTECCCYGDGCNTDIEEIEIGRINRYRNKSPREQSQRRRSRCVGPRTHLSASCYRAAYQHISE
ncbi:hypothetical protein AAVH_29872 [Aphelenchoides avenae]|nr:hypothetical protein AAVH_29872 [Aphelenchus avenae]